MRCKNLNLNFLKDCEENNPQILIGKVNYMTRDAFQALKERQAMYPKRMKACGK